jgi:hypothetical protein
MVFDFTVLARTANHAIFSKTDAIGFAGGEEWGKVISHT